MEKPVRLSEIAQTFESVSLFEGHLGADPTIQAIRPIDDCGPGSLTFVNDKAYLETALKQSPSAIVLRADLVEAVPAAQRETLGLLPCANVKLAHALIKQRYAGRDYHDAQWQRVHETAVIHPTAIVPETCIVGPRVVIGENVVLGERCRLLAGVVVENGARIGDDGVFHPNCVIGYECELGNAVEVGACSVVGSDGFGYAQDREGKSYKIPQTGYVILEDRVELGACNCIDRATYSVTRIGAGTKTDNFVHIAHNVDVGEDCLFTPMLAVAGTSKIGKRVITSGQTEISDHITICDDVVLFHRAGVTRDITEPGMYAGLPTQPLNQYMKNTATFRKLDQLNKKVAALEKQLKQLQSHKE